MRQLHYLGWLASVLAACSGESDEALGGACSRLVACGGDVVGAWQIEQMCVSQADIGTIFDDTLPPACSGSLTAAEATPVGLRVTYAEDGTWTKEGATRIHIEYTLTTDCLSAINDGPTAPSESLCRRIGEGTQSRTKLQDPEGTASCALVNDTCNCENTFQRDTTADGTYVLDGNYVVTEEEDLPYCVSGDRMEYGDAVAKSVARRE